MGTPTYDMPFVSPTGSRALVLPDKRIEVEQCTPALVSQLLGDVASVMIKAVSHEWTSAERKTLQTKVFGSLAYLAFGQ